MVLPAVAPNRNPRARASAASGHQQRNGEFHLGRQETTWEENEGEFKEKNIYIYIRAGDFPLKYYRWFNFEILIFHGLFIIIHHING